VIDANDTQYGKGSTAFFVQAMRVLYQKTKSQISSSIL